MPLEMADTNGVFARAIKVKLISPPSTATSHPWYTNSKGPCKESFTSVLYMGKQEVLKARRR